MNIFISWSGETSKEIASALKNWIPTVLQSAKPYFTASDIEKGSKWEIEITDKLNESKVGIICLTNSNTEKPWILFEAGALSNKLEKSRVCPILFGLTNSDLKGPLATFQTTEFNKEDFRKLMKSINILLDEFKISDSVFDVVYEAFFPKLETEINTILENSKLDETNQIAPKRSDRDILEEILELARKQYVKPKVYSNNKTETQKIIDYLEKKNPQSIFIDSLTLLPGDRIIHERFGEGNVIDIMISNDIDDSKIDIEFDIVGLKKLLLKYANVKKL